MDLVNCTLGNVLVVPIFATMYHYVCKDAGDTSGKRWNYLSKNLFGNFAEITISSPFI